MAGRIYSGKLLERLKGEANRDHLVEALEFEVDHALEVSEQTDV